MSSNILDRVFPTDNYFGCTFDAYRVLYAVSRDADLLDQVNFETIEARFKSANVFHLIPETSHWACGWIKWFLIPAENEEAVKLSNEILESLERYPVLDEDEWFTRRNDAYREYIVSEVGEKGLELYEARADYRGECDIDDIDLDALAVIEKLLEGVQ